MQQLHCDVTSLVRSGIKVPLHSYTVASLMAKRAMNHCTGLIHIDGHYDGLSPTPRHHIVGVGV